jgi:hypothetical protein
MVEEEDTQPLTQPIIAPIVQKKYQHVESTIPETTYPKQ